VPQVPAGYTTSADYRRSNGPRFHGATTAWAAGKTGAGQTIAIIDTGIFTTETDLAGRISPASTGIGGNTTHVGEDDHGTLVALVAAAANNNSGSVGIAYDATILAIRADKPGSCASDECSFGDVSEGIDYAVTRGAKVINISLGGSGGTSAEIAAIRPAPAAGVLAGAGSGNVIIVGSVDSSGTISDFSNRAGSASQYYLTALGSRVAVYIGGQGYQISGTSFSAPQVSGAVALLAQAFPTLSATDIVELLLVTAQDVGVAGIDDIYGYGVLDISRAFAPRGTTRLAGTDSAMPLGDTSATGSPAMGDALSTASLSTVVLDRYRRAYTVDLGNTMRGAAISDRLRGAVGSQGRFLSANAGNASLAFTVDGSGQGAGLDAASQLRLSPVDAEAARVLAARIALRLSPKVQLGLTFAESPDGLVAQLQGQDRPLFLVAPLAAGDDGVFRRTDMSFALRRTLGPSWGLTVSGESGQAISGAPVEQYNDRIARPRRDLVRSFGLALDREFGPLQAVLGLNWMSEERTVLGGRFHDAFGGGGAETLFLDSAASWQFADGWRLVGSMRNGWTFPDGGGAIARGSRIYSRAWSLDLERRGLFGAHDALGLRIAQPLRVEAGGLDLSLPVAYSYDTESASFGIRALSLSPHGRELMGELGWHGPLWAGQASASLFYRAIRGTTPRCPTTRAWRSAGSAASEAICVGESPGLKE